MDVQEFEKLASVFFQLWEMLPMYGAWDNGQVEGGIHITLKKGSIVPDAGDLEFEDECGGIHVEIDVESDSESEYAKVGSDSNKYGGDDSGEEVSGINS